MLYGANAANGVIKFRTLRNEGGPLSAVHFRAGTQGERIGGARAGNRAGPVSLQLAVEHDQDEGLGRHQGRSRADSQEFLTASGAASVEPAPGWRLATGARSRFGQFTFAEQTVNFPASPRELQTYLAHVRLERNPSSEEGWGFHVQADRRRQVVHNRVSGARQQREDSQANEINTQLTLPFSLAGRHRWAVGGGFRDVVIEHAQLKGGEQGYDVANGYLHDEYAPAGWLRLHGGVKLEKFSQMPSTVQWRLAAILRPGDSQALRLSAANAVRSPSLYECYQETIVPIAPDVAAQITEWPEGARQEQYRIVGDPGLETERFHSYEAEYRIYLAKRFLLDIDYAYREADRLTTSFKTDPGYFVQPEGAPEPLGPLGMYYEWLNAGSLKSHSVNVGLEFRPSEAFRILTSAAWVEMHNTEGFDKIGGRERNQPRVFGRSQIDWLPGWGLETGAGLRYHSDYPQDLPQGRAEEYWRLDARLAWRQPTERGDLVLQFAGYNLTDEWHTEPRQEVRRMYLATLALEM